MTKSTKDLKKDELVKLVEAQEKEIADLKKSGIRAEHQQFQNGKSKVVISVPFTEGATIDQVYGFRASGAPYLHSVNIGKEEVIVEKLKAMTEKPKVEEAGIKPYSKALWLKIPKSTPVKSVASADTLF